MSDNTSSDQMTLPDEDPEAGEPIRSLRDLEHDTSFLFLRRLRGKIHRRTTASQLLSFSLQLPKIAFFEMGSILAYIVRSLGTQKEE